MLCDFVVLVVVVQMRPPVGFRLGGGARSRQLTFCAFAARLSYRGVAEELASAEDEASPLGVQTVSGGRGLSFPYGGPELSPRTIACCARECTIPCLESSSDFDDRVRDPERRGRPRTLGGEPECFEHG